MDLEKAKARLEPLKDLRKMIATHRGAKEKRVLGELVWAPPFILHRT
jgi:hypothetical protein